MKTKVCNVCKTEKDIKEFRKNSRAPNGIGYKCTECNREQYSQWRRNNLDKAAKRDREYRKNNLNKVREQTRGRVAVQKEIKKGNLLPLSEAICVECGNQANEYHHPNYDFPKQVIPLCKTCHVALHAELAK